MNTLKAIAMVTLLGTAVVISSSASANERTKGRGTGPIVL